MHLSLNNMNVLNKATNISNDNIVCASYRAQVMNPYTRIDKYGAIRVVGNCNDAKLEIKAAGLDKIDCIFTESGKLDKEAIIHFHRTLSNVSAVELDDENYQRIFSLKKSIEVSHDNINLLIPFLWQRLWNVLIAYCVNIKMIILFQLLQKIHLKHSQLIHAIYIVESILQEYFQLLKMDTNVAISNGASKIVEEESSEGNDVHKVLDTDTLDEVT